MNAVLRTEASSPGPVPHLELLAVRLRAANWYVSLIATAGREPYLRVVNPHAVVLNDDVTARPDAAGLWFYHWSFGDRICYVGNLDIAVDRIARVLASEDNGR